MPFGPQPTHLSSSSSSSTPSALSTTILNSLTTIHSIYQTYLLPVTPQPLRGILTTFDPFPLVISTLTSILNNNSTASGDVVSIAAFLVVLYMTLRLADYVRRSLFGWVFFWVKVAVFLGLVQLVVHIQRVGLDKGFKDAGWFGGVLWGWAEDWINEAGRSVTGNNNNNRGGMGQKVFGGGGGGAGNRRGAWS